MADFSILKLNSPLRAMLQVIILLTLVIPLNAAEFQVKDGTNVNLRSGPGTSYKKAGRLKSGSKIEELERNENWSKVRTEDGKIVWVHNGFIVKAGITTDPAASNFSLIPPIGLTQSIGDTKK